MKGESMDKFKFTEVPGNIFDYEGHYKIVHCTSSDFKCNSLFSSIVDNRYNIQEKLKESFPYERWRERGYALYTPGVFTLITKFRWNDMVPAERMKEALESLKNLMIHYKINRVVLPRIEEDSLIWNDQSETCVHQLISLVFGGFNLEVKVVYPPQTKEDLWIMDPDLELIHFGEDRKHIDGNTEKKYN
jgi:hypothetical protein